MECCGAWCGILSDILFLHILVQKHRLPRRGGALPCRTSPLQYPNPFWRRTMAHAAFNWQDPFLLDTQLSDDERQIKDAAAAYCQDKLQPRVTQAFRDATTDPAIFREMGELGLLGPTIPEQYGGPGLNYVAYGLIAREVERVDSGLPIHDERAELAGDGAHL